MNENGFYDALKKYALDSKSYKEWRKVHTKAFGRVFEEAFSENEEAQICLTAALIHISQRSFEAAMPKLDMLEAIGDDAFDKTAVCYFKGLNYEMLGREAEMTDYYEKVKTSSIALTFPLPFHPYYRTAKLAQRGSECIKSLYYYRKALELYDGAEPDSRVASVVSHLIYDMATLCLYMHEYDECERFLKLSHRYDGTENPHRDYVHAILLATRGRHEECADILKTLNPFLRENCQAMTDAILAGKDLHYCVVPQDRSLYGEFWTAFANAAEQIRRMVEDNMIQEAENCISEKLTKAFSFMKRPLACRIEESNGKIVVRCKNYRVKTLIAEHLALLSRKPAALSAWQFLSVEEFEVL